MSALAIAGVATAVPAHAGTPSASVRATVIADAGAELYLEPGEVVSHVTLGQGDVVTASCFSIVDGAVWIRIEWGDYAPRWAQREALDLSSDALPAC